MKRIIRFLTTIFKKKDSKKPIDVMVSFKQSTIFELIKDTDAVYQLKHPKLETQATKHRESIMVKIVFMGDNAYWIKDSVFYVADLDESGLIDASSARAVDTMTMNKVELDKMSFIVDKLTEGI